MLTEQERHRLYTRLGEVLGSEEAETMIELLPPGSWADIATNQRVDQLGADLRAEMAELRGELTVRMVELESGLTNRMTQLESGLTNRMTELDSGLTNRMTELDSGLTSRMTELDSGLTNRMSQLESGFDKRLIRLGSDVGTQISALEASLLRELSLNMRTVVAANLAASIAIGGMLVAALKI